MTVKLPLNALPSDPKSRSEKLHHYFSDLRCHSSQTDSGWEIELYWPPTLDYFIDPEIEKGLRWWGNEVQCDTVFAQYRAFEHFQLSLHDSWSLYGWSQWLKSKSEAGITIDEVIIIHLDDHDDLMSPRVYKANGQFIDLLTKKEINLYQPESVHAAINSGAIGIGSFIMLLLHTISKVRIYHICATEYSTIRKDITHLERTKREDDLLYPGALRPDAKFISNRASHDDSSISYKVMSSFDECFSNIPNDLPILLHIDMDYFNNRFNGDSDWKNHSNRHDPDYANIYRTMKLLFEKIAFYNLLNQVENTTVALSPGFFPAEFWDQSVMDLSAFFDSIK